MQPVMCQWMVWIGINSQFRQSATSSLGSEAERFHEEMARLHQRTVSPWMVAMETNPLHTDAQPNSNTEQWRESAMVRFPSF